MSDELIKQFNNDQFYKVEGLGSPSHHKSVHNEPTHQYQDLIAPSVQRMIADIKKLHNQSIVEYSYAESTSGSRTIIVTIVYQEPD